MTPAIQVDGVTVRYGGADAAPAIRDAALSVRPGELALLMGPSGSGKTTLLTVMGCLRHPDAGTVRVAGKDVTRLTELELPEVRRTHIGFVFQTINLFSALTASENVEIALDLAGRRGAPARRLSRQALDAVGLGAFLERTPSELSGGQRQRVAIARALVGDPDVLLCDEPTAALDSKSAAEVMRILRARADAGRAVVVVTHDPRLTAYADRVIRVADGRIVEDRATTPEERRP